MIFDDELNTVGDAGDDMDAADGEEDSDESTGEGTEDESM